MAADTLIERLHAGGIVHPKVTIAEAQHAGLRLAVACAMLEKETAGGHNVFGHDPTIFVGAGKVTKAKYLANDSTVFDQGYWTIPGSIGDNDTNAETGQFFKLDATNFAIAHTSSDGRGARDVRLVLAAAATGVPPASAWITANAANQQAVMPKIGPLGKRIFLSYGLWDSTSRTNHAITWYGQLLDQTLKPVADPVKLSGVEFVAAQPLFTFPAGPNAGQLGWVSGNAQGGMTVNVVHGGA